MSDIMRPIPFAQLMDWIFAEHETHGSIFGVRKVVRHEGGADPIFSERIETPFGPAAGPNSQLAQNIVASYVAGSRFFELKTVQVMDGEELSRCVAKPCIVAEDECYNCEWSTELTVPDAMDEYIKAWWACKLLSREFGLGAADGFVFNMSVGYDLEGIKSPKVDAYIEGMKDASATAIWAECRSWALANLGRFEHVDEAFVGSVSPHVSTSVTESTLHGCPPDEIERIATYLIREKHLNTYIKCNPTLLGYDYARTRLDGLGFDYIAFDDGHFVEDLQWADAVPMFERLMKLTGELGLAFGVKLTNTFPVDVTAGELPSEEMYMSGRSLYALTIHLARRISEQFAGNTAMDAARVAKRLPGVENVRIVYRRTKRYMPADEEELREALEDGVEFCELLAPKGVADGALTCERMALGEPDDSGRRSPVPTGETVQVPATAVICAVGEHIEDGVYASAGVELDRKGRPAGCATGVDGVWAAGDCRRGPATFVEAIADSQQVAMAMVGASFDAYAAANAAATVEGCYERKGTLACAESPCANSRCLGCARVCEACCDVCPNRANVAIEVPGLAQHQVVHVDGMCNECGNCAVFCPWEGRPYKDKLTLFWSAEDMDNSENRGWLPLADGTARVRLASGVATYNVEDASCGLPEEVRLTILAVRDSYGYLISR